MQRKRSFEGRGRDWGDTTMSQETPKIARRPAREGDRLDLILPQNLQKESAFLTP